MTISINNPPDDARDYYCSLKFRYIKIDLESQTTYTCHASQPHKVDFAWLNNNPGNLFNHEINLKERQMMLRNERAPSCEQNCWYAEDQGQISPRLYQKGYQRTHDQINTLPEMVDLTVGPQCNLSCSYCCKEYSSSWRQDLMDNGPYDLSSKYNDRYHLSDRDRVLMKISQPSLVNSSRYKSLMQEISRVAHNLKQLDVTGGEPFLNNQLSDFLNNLDLPIDSVINIYTGLGVDHNRFSRMLEKVSLNPRVRLSVSAENIGPYLEFNRYGITWNKFQKNLQSIIDHKIQFRLHSTLTNLTAFGFKEFYDFYKEHDIMLTFAYQPRMQGMNVMDIDSKNILDETFLGLPEKYRVPLKKTLSSTPTEIDRQDMAKFLKDFVKRRTDLNLGIYPKSFINWLGIDRVV